MGNARSAVTGAHAGRPPLDELRELLALLRASDTMPWPDLGTTMAEEHRVLWLGRQAGAEGEALAYAILDETERLFAAAEQAQLTAVRGRPA